MANLVDREHFYRLLEQALRDAARELDRQRRLLERLTQDVQREAARSLR